MGSSLTFPVVFLSVFVLFCWNEVCCLGTSTFDVRRFGAVSDGKTDNSKAFLNAWRAACQSASGGKILITAGTFLVNPIELRGPCTGRITFKVSGVIKAPNGNNPGTNGWIMFDDINGLTIRGSGTFDGQGASAWSYNNCKNNPTCNPLPLSIALTTVSNALIQGITSLNSKGFHIGIVNGGSVTIQHVTIRAPADSPNTDGIHTQNTNKIKIIDSNIGTGDDCISIGEGSTNINITGVNCGPGHGISIGSIGKHPSDKGVKGIHVASCKMTSTQNGVRIKTWTPSRATTVSDVTFQDITMNNANNPIIIDQQYCGGPHNCHGNSRVEVSNVKFIGVRGTSNSVVAVSLQCSSSAPCEGIQLNNINLSLSGGGRTTSSCSNARETFTGQQNPPPCSPQ